MANGGNPNPNPGVQLPAWILEMIACVFAWAVLVGFIACYTVPIYHCWQGKSEAADAKADGAPKPAGTIPNQTELYVYISTALSGLIGAVVAMIFSVQIPTTPQGGKMRTASLALQRTFAFSSSLTWKQWLALGYVIGYMALGVVAIVTSLVAPGHSDMVQNFALIVFGVILAIVQKLFSV
jgi:hypothetical protein